MQSSNSIDTELVPLLEFVYRITSSWAATLEKYNDDVDNVQGKQALLLYECIFFFMYVLNRIAYQKLSKSQAERLYQNISSIIIIGIVGFVSADNTDIEVKNKAKLDLFAKMELAQVSYMRNSKSEDIAEERTRPLVSKLQKRVAAVLGHENDSITKRINLLTENLYTAFLTEHLIPMEKLVVQAGKAL